MRTFVPLFALLLALFSTPLLAQQPLAPIAVHFPRGTQTTTVSGTLMGNGTADYTIEVELAQTVQLKLSGASTLALELYAPDQDAALNAGKDPMRFSGLLATPGTYLIHIRQRDAATDPAQAAHYTLSIGLR